MTRRILITAVCLSFFAFPLFVMNAERQLHAAISIDNFSAATNDRFADDPAFIGAAYDFSGVGRATGGRWATLVAPNIFLTAQHFSPAVNEDIFFYRQNDPTSVPVVRTVVGAQQILNSDLRIGYFDLPVTLSIADYAFSQIPVTTGNFGSTLEDEFAIMSGKSPTTADYVDDETTDMAIGQNRVEVFTPTFSLNGSTGDVIELVHNSPGDPGYLYETYEAELNGGDSGGPLMLIDNGQLQVAGTAWAKGEKFVPGRGNRVTSIYTYTGNLAAEINDYIASHVQLRLPGDYNANGVVDAADFTVWRDHLGSTTQLDADGSGNGVIDQSDYDIWRTNFGGPPLGTATVIPEPALRWLVLLGGLCLAASRQLVLSGIESRQ